MMSAAAAPMKTDKGRPVDALFVRTARWALSPNSAKKRVEKAAMMILNSYSSC